MGWNGSVANKTELGNQRQPRRGRARNKILLGIIAVIASCICLLLFRERTSLQKIPQSAPKPEVVKNFRKPVKFPKSEIVEKTATVIDPDARPTKVGEIVNNYIRLPSGKLHFIRGEVTNDLSKTVKKDWFAIFDRQCDNEIALCLSIEPGESIVGTPVFRGRFVKDFIESLKEPIIPSQDDCEEIKELKRAVNAAKIELKEAYDRGEDIEQIMVDTRKQLQDLGIYKKTLESDLREAIKTSAETSEDITDFIKAANKLLEEKGIAPMELNFMSRMRLERMLQQKMR